MSYWFSTTPLPLPSYLLRQELFEYLCASIDLQQLYKFSLNPCHSMSHQSHRIANIVCRNYIYDGAYPYPWPAGLPYFYFRIWYFLGKIFLSSDNMFPYLIEICPFSGKMSPLSNERFQWWIAGFRLSIRMSWWFSTAALLSLESLQTLPFSLHSSETRWM